MIVVRNVFIARPGQASKLAAMKECQANPEARKAMTGYTDLYLTGHRELLQSA
jgi:hypothetical protein